jgi:Tol biopolymer transport system component
MLPGKTYTLRLAPQHYGINGERLKEEKNWEVRLRPTQIIYLAAYPKPSELFRVGLDGGEPVQITQSNGKVADFAVDPAGERIVYSVINEQHGRNLWQMGHAGENARILLDCGPDRCSTPDFAPDGLRLTYTREPGPLGPGMPYGAPRPWMLDFTIGQTGDGVTRPVYSDQQIIGYGPTWSSDGRRLAIWDGVNGGIRVLELGSGLETFISTESGNTGSWSPDGDRLVFTRYGTVGETYHSFVFMADFKAGSEMILINGGDRDAAFGEPVWSPDGHYIAISMNPKDAKPTRSIWLVNPNTLAGTTIGGEANYAYGNYRWNPWGTAVAFQRSLLGGEYASEIGVYSLETGKTQILAASGTTPQWLP